MGPERLPNRLDMIGAPLRGACAACSKYSEKLNMVKILGSNTYLWHLVGYRSISKLIKCTVLATNLRERERAFSEWGAAAKASFLERSLVYLRQMTCYLSKVFQGGWGACDIGLVGRSLDYVYVLAVLGTFIVLKRSKSVDALIVGFLECWGPCRVRVFMSPRLLSVAHYAYAITPGCAALCFL